MADRKPTLPADEPMTYRKDDHVTTEGAGEGYEQKITRESNDGSKSEVRYFDRLGRELFLADQLPGNPDRVAEGKPAADSKHHPEHKH